MLKHFLLFILFFNLINNLFSQNNSKYLIDFIAKKQNCLNDDKIHGVEPNIIDLDKLKTNFKEKELFKIIYTKSEIIKISEKLGKTNSIKDSIKFQTFESKFKIPILEFKPDSEHIPAFCVFKINYNNRLRDVETSPNWLCIFINPYYKNLIIEDSVRECIKKYSKTYPYEMFPLFKHGNEKVSINIINEVLGYSVRAVNKYDKDRKDIITKIKEKQNSSKQSIYKDNILEEASLQVLNKYNDTVKFKTKEFFDNEEKRKRNEEAAREKKKSDSILEKAKIEKEKEDFKIKNLKYRDSSIKLIVGIIKKSDVNDIENLNSIKKIIEMIEPTDTHKIKLSIDKCIKKFKDGVYKEEKFIYEGSFEKLIKILNDRLEVLKGTSFNGININLNFLQSYFNYNFNNNLLAEKITNGVDKFPDKAENYASISDFNKYKGQYLQTNKIKNNKIFQSGNENFILNHFYVSAIAKLNPTKLFKLKKPIENLSVGAGIGIGFINYKSSVIKSIDINNYTKSSRTRDTAGNNLFKDKISEIYRIDSSSNSYIEEHIFTNSLIYLNLIDLSVQYKIPIKKNKFSIEDVQCNLGFSAGVPISFTSTYYAYYKNNEKNPLPNINTNPTLKAGLITNFYVNPILNFKIKNQLIGLGLLISLGSVGLNNESSDAIEKTGIENSLNSFSIKNFGFNIVYHFSKK